MIISNVHITNYKQYIDEHDIAIPEAATVGVIGQNGVGKTTLFEAIEWCLYNPSSIATKDIKPRGRGGVTKVVVTLNVPSTGEQYLVERELKRTSTTASIYRVEPDGEEVIIVQGTKQVTEHVEKHLVGLNHSAFTATFFTRQKELSFFGDLGATARRREVGKLLGLETIRSAQQLIAADRASALSTAKVLRSRYEAESQGRNFAEELETADKKIVASRQELGEAQAEADKAKAAMDEADTALAAQQELKDRDGAVARKLIQQRGELATGMERKQGIEAELSRLQEREKERATLHPIAERAEQLGAEETRLDVLHKAAVQRRQVEHELASLRQRRADVLSSVQNAVTSSRPPQQLSGWTWGNGDHEDPVAGCDRLLVSISQVNIHHAEAAAQGLLDLRSLGREHEAETKKLEKYHATVRELHDQLAQFSNGHDPAAALEAVSTRIVELQKRESEVDAQLAQVTAEQQKTQALANNLRQQQFDDVCPTCQRPFSNEDAAIVLGAFESRLGELDGQLASLRQERDSVRNELKSRQQERKNAERRVEELGLVRQRIEASKPHVETQQATVEAVSARLTTTMQRLDRSALPSDDDIVQATEVIDGWRRIINTRDQIARAKESLAALSQQQSEIAAKLEGLGEVAYDEAAHAQVRREHREALQAQTTVAQIDRDLARRPQLQADLETCTIRISEINAAITETEKERAGIGFDAAKLQAAQIAMREAREAANIANERRHRVDRDLHQAQNQREAIEKDQKRIAALATDADARQHEHDQLDQMYREFTEFERFAAAWYAPKLSDMTSELVADVTDGKYDRVVFDNNFGIDVYDGDEEKFPLETFSGGERDVIALCARIALSRVIGNQGTHPPGFLVLDEVFGSLDRDRRARLLDMLGSITTSGEYFRQIFMISHVDDVRTAPIFDELWQVVEDGESGSAVQPLAPGTDIGEL